MKILIAEDNRDMRELLKAQVKNICGQSVTLVEAGNGGAAVERFKMDGPFDLVITDFMMPVFNGDYVCKSVRELDEKIPIVCQTSEPAKALANPMGVEFDHVFDKCDGNEQLKEYLKTFCPVEASDN